MKIRLNNLKEKVTMGFLFLLGIWVISALALDITMLILHFLGKDDTTQAISNWLSWKFDGTFKNLPENIWYK